MKKITIKPILVLLFVCTGLFTQLFAQVPEGISYQAVARDGSGAILASQNMDVKFEIRETAAGGTVIYDETHVVMTNDYGLFTAIIGTGTTGIGVFNTIQWGGDDHFVRVLIDTGSGFVNMGTSQLMSVPYSMMAKRAEKATNMDLSDLTNVNAAAPSNGQVLKWNGTDWIADTDNAGAGGTSPWAISGTDVSYTGGDVGIGTANPSHPFHIVHSTTSANAISVEAGTPPSSRDVLEIKVDAATSDGAQFIEMERGTSIVAAINTDGSAEFLNVTVEDELDGATVPVKGRVYSNGLPIAYGYVSSGATTATLITDYGVASLTKTASVNGEYRITLDKTVVGQPVIIATSFGSSPNDEIVTANRVSSTEIEINIVDGSGTTTNSNFYFVVFGNTSN